MLSKYEKDKARILTLPPEERTRRIRSQWSTPDRWSRYRCTALRSKAKQSGIPFDISPKDIAVPDRCPVLGVEFAFGMDRGHPNAPSVDRIIPEKGYVRGNVRVICWIANTLKRNCSDPTVFRAIAEYLEKNS